MRSPLTWALALTGTAAAAAVSSTGSSETPPSTWKRANLCAKVQDAARKYIKENPDEPEALVEPSLAIGCLRSVSVHKQEDLDLLKYLEPYVNFHSTLKTLVNPPEGYLVPGVDIIKGFDQIRTRLKKNKYDCQLDFANDLRNLFLQAADGHFLYRPAILDVFTFWGSLSLLSVSKSTTEPPKIYLESDIEKIIKDKNTIISEIKTISWAGLDKPRKIYDFLRDLAHWIPHPDPDAKYNELFESAANLAKGKYGVFRARDTTNAVHEEVLHFADGSSQKNIIWAKVDKSYIDYIGTPESIRDNFELPPKNAARSIASTNASTAASTTAAVVKRTEAKLDGNYPKPVAFHKSEWVSGYFIDSNDDYKDIAVLVVLAFMPWDPSDDMDIDDEIAEARRTTAEFLAKAKAAGKKKLIIDVQGNGGGWIEAGFQMYRQLFPKDDDVWDGTRLRAHKALDVLMGIAEKSAPEEYSFIIDTPLNKNRKRYKNWADLYGPEVISGEDVTKLLRYDLEEEFPSAKVEGEQPFAAENIVVITDGRCVSTCATFVGRLSREKGVRTIAFGGRPSKMAMQAIGGTKGSRYLMYDSLRSSVEDIVEAAEGDKKKMDLLEKNKAVIPNLGEPPLLPPLAQAGAFNMGNTYNRKNVNGYPNQFIYEAANCRLWYEKSMPDGPVDIWIAAAKVAWKKAKCAPGSTANKDGTISDKTLKYHPQVKSDAQKPKGPGSPLYKGA